MCPLVQKAAIVAGHAQKGRRGGGDTHQLTVLTAQACTQFHYAYHKGHYRVKGVVASMKAERGDTSSLAII